jgi:site-specific DNA-methyltransferase (adenine-specific)
LDESAERAFDEVLTGGHCEAAIMLRAMRSALGENDMMAYLVMMTIRLIELHRVLKTTGSLYFMAIRPRATTLSCFWTRSSVP